MFEEAIVSSTNDLLWCGIPPLSLCVININVNITVIVLLESTSWGAPLLSGHKIQRCQYMFAGLKEKYIAVSYVDISQL